jgi:hypothetical protein
MLRWTITFLVIAIIAAILGLAESLLVQQASLRYFSIFFLYCLCCHFLLAGAQLNRHNHL